VARIEVRAIDLKTERDAFLRFPWQVMEADPHWVPPLIFERRAFFDPDSNPYFQNAEVQCFMAFRDGKPVGTISAHIDKGYQAVEPDVGFFGFYEFIDDVDIARSLLETALDWLADRGMCRAMGPFNFNTNHECGLLIDGFDIDPLVLMTHNPPHYPEIYGQLGLVKMKDLYAYWIDIGPVPARIAAIADRFAQRNPEFTVRPVDTRNYRAEVEIARKLYNDAWADNWGFVQLTDAEFDKVAADLKPMVDSRFCYVVEREGVPVAFSITLPDYNQVVKPMNGRLFPLGWWHYLTRRSKVNQVRVFALGVAKEWQHKPLGALLYKRTWEAAEAAGMRGGEASWILDDNHNMRSALEKLGGRIHKTYRIYFTDLSETAEVRRIDARDD
jgi:GNAT superfamily N-acetyltransferase